MIVQLFSVTQWLKSAVRNFWNHCSPKGVCRISMDRVATIAPEKSAPVCIRKAHGCCLSVKIAVWHHIFNQSDEKILYYSLSALYVTSFVNKDSKLYFSSNLYKNIAFSALTLLVGRDRKGIRPVKNWVVGCWRGYLSGARCSLAYSPADATATHCLLLQ